MTGPAVVGTIGPIRAEPEAWSDDALAIVFTQRHGTEYRFVATTSKWLRWTGAVWVADDTLRVFDLVRLTCREIGQEAAKGAAKLASAQTVAAVERLARSDPIHAATIDQWDADPMLLNTPGGVVDLTDGSLRPHRPEDYCTKQTAGAPGGDAPRWLAVLDRATNGDAAYVAFLQRWFGYCLTGSTREHAVLAGFGTGANSKSLIVNTIGRVLGNYATVAPITTFTASAFDRHPTDMAMLRGARFVVAQETEEGRKWDAARIKSLTGGDPITARFMRQDFFTFQPQFKLTVIGNHRPALQQVDEAMRRRLMVAPFVVTIPPAERDPQLMEKLEPEYPGILAWLIEGCVRWQREGLNPPATVTANTAEYFEAEDTVATWLTECCRVRPSLQAKTGDLFRSWTEWAKSAGEHSGSAKTFSERLLGKGFERTKLGHKRDRGFTGLCLETDDGRRMRTHAD